MHSRTRGVRAALVALICALFFASPASPALEDALETSKMIVGEVRDYIRTVTTEGLAPLGREGVTAEGGPYPYLEGAENLEMRPCEEVCADKLLPGGGIAPPSLSPELLSQGFQACTTPCYYARTMMRAPSSGDLFQSGIEADLSFGQGRFTQAPYGLFTINFVSQHFYMYTPPRGTKPDEDCQNEGLPVGCPYQPGDVNPYGMRKIDMSSGKHLPPPIMEYAPLQMEYDLLSKSILILTHGYPKENPPTTEVTLTNGDKSYTEIKPILSLIAIDEASGRPVTPGTVGPTITGGPYYTVTFCSTCNLRPDPNLTLGFQFLYDYTDTYSNTSTFDQVDQMFWTVLWNPQYPESKTLFGVRRVTDFDSLATEPLNNRWTLRVDYARMQHYTWPREFMSLSALEFSPVMTQQVTNTEGINSFVRIEDPANVKALYAIVTFTDRAGPCAPPIGEPATEGGLPPNNGKGYRCGRELTSSDITLHNLVAAQSFRGTLTYNAAEPVYCQCPSALVQLNVNYRGAIATANSRMTLGNAALDASGEPYTILKWMDPNYETWRTWNTNSLTSAQLTEEPSASLVPFLSSMMAMQPSPTGSVVDELPASFYFANYNMPIVDERTPGELDPRFTTDTEGVTAPRPSADRSDAEENPYGIWEYTIGTDIAKVNALTAKIGQPRPPLFMFSEDQYSRIIQQRVSDMFIVATSPQRTFLTGPSNGIVASEFVCRVPAPLTTAQCRAKYQLEIEAIIGRRITGEEDFKATWQSLYPTAYSRELFVLEPLREDRRGNPLPQELIFVCPDELPVNDDGSVGDGKPDDEPFTCSQCAEMYNNPCKFYVTAGTRTSLTITAVTIFGAVSVSRNDNFTAFIESPSFEDASNLGSLPEAEFVLGPVFRQAFQIDASGQPFGERLRGSEVTPLGQVAPDPLMASWDFPNYHNMYKEPAQLPPRAWYDLNDRIERDCSATPLIPEGRCFRWLSRPRILGDAGGIYELSFGLDRAGLYSLSVGYRGTADPYDSEGNAVLGTGIKGSPFEMTVIAGRVDNRLSQAVELPTEAFEDGCPVDEDACGKLDEGIIGVRGLFAVQPRDRFGNDVVDQRSFVLEVSFRGVQYVQASTARPAAAESTTTAWAKISSVENSGLKKIEYFLTSRSRVDPNYSAFITINNRPISGPSVMVDEEARPDQSLTESSLQPYRITVLPAPTKGGTSFAVEARASENGLGVQAPVIAGFEATFSIRARDRFGNSQGFPDGTEYATTEDTNFKSTDPFMVVVEDANGNCGVDVVADVRDEGAFVFPGAADAWGVTNAQGNRACVGKTQWDALGESADPKPPKVEVYREERTTHVDGLYSVKYTMQKAGETKITAYLCDINLLVSSGRCGLSPAPNKPATSTQANVFGEALQVEPQAGVNQWPHVLTVQAGPTRPGMSTALGAGVDTFQAGTVGEQGGGVDFFVTARDQFGNVKTNPERALLEVRNMPRMVVRYQTDCAGTVVDHPTKGCEGIYQRQISLVGRSSVKINEVPLRLSGSTVYSASEARVTFTTSTVYLGNSPDTLGVFRTRFTTTLAGRFDIRIDLPRGVRGGTIEDQRYPIKGANSKVGGARLMPYEEPYPLVVTPGEFSGAFSEVFFFMDSNKTLVSSHHGLSHQFTTSDTSVTAAKMTSAGVIGRADVDQNTFYIQARDRYANAKTDLASGEGFSSITITAFDPSSKSTLVLKSTCGGSDATLTSEASPNRGLWSVRYCSRRALRYTIAVASSSGQELTRVAYDNTSGSLQATSERFVLTVRAGAPSAAHFTASGDGLRGATFKGVTENLSTGVSVSVGEIFVVARDEYGNRIDGTLAEAQQIAAQLQLKLWICDYTAAPECLFSDSDCTFQNREATEKLTSSPTKAEDGTYFETTIWEPVRGQAGTFKIVWTPRPWPGDCTENKYYTYLDIEYQTTRIGGTESGQGFPQLAVAHNGAGGTLDVAKSFVSSWNGAELGAYEGSVVGEAQTIVVTLVSEDGFVLRNRSSVGEITVVLTKTGSTRLGTTGVDDVVLTLEATAAELQGSGQIRYNSDGAIVITIPAKESIDDSAAGISEEGFYKIDIKLVPTVESGATAPAAESINGMPFVDLFFRPAPTSPRFTRVRHHPEVSSSAPLVDPGNISGANVPELYQTISGSTALLVTAGEPIKFRLEARDDFNNRQLGSKTSSSSALVTNPDNFAVVVAAAPPSAPLSVTSTTDNGDGTYDLEVSQTAQGTYTLRFYLTSDPRSQGPETLLQGAGETAAGSLVRGLLGRPSPGPSASDFSLPVRIVPGPAHVPNFTASWNLDRMSVGDLQDVTITEADEFGNIRPTVTSTGSPPEPVYLNVSFVFAPSGEAESGAFRYSIPGGVTTVIPAGTVIGQSIDYEAGYEIAPEDATHVFTHIVGHGATIPEAGDVLKAGNFLMEITGAGGVHIEGSPFEMRFETRADQAAFRIENSFAYGPGITLLPGDENTPAGTVRKGEAKPFFVQLRDTYGNVLTRRPKGQVNIRVQLFEPSALTGELGDAIRDFGCQEELVDGSYEGLYRCERAYCECTSTPCKTTCYSYMVIKVTAAGQGVLPAANYSVADPNVVLDEDPVGSILYEYQDGEGRRFPVTDGVVVKLLSGEASPGDSFADDPDCNIASRQRGGGRGCQARITGGTNWGNMTAGDNLNFRVRLFDKFQQPKTDMDEGSNVLVRLYMMRDQFGTSIGIQPWLGTELDAPEDADGNPVWASVRHPRNLGFDVFSRNITVTAPPDSTGTMRIDPSNYGYTPEGIVLPRAGFYELHVLFVKENPDAPDGFEEIHFAEGTIRGSPYNIYVAPGKSDPSSLPSQANLGEAATGTPGAINTPAAASRRRLAGLPVATVTDPRIERALRQLRSDRVVPVNKRLYSDTPLMTGSRNAARRLAQTVAEEEPARISFEVPAGEVYDLVLDLKDSIGNQQVFSPLKPLDTALVRIGDVLEGAKPCVWLPLDPDRLDLTQRIDTVNSDDECQVVHTGFDFETLCQSTADGCPADVSLKQQNDIAMGKLTMQFTVEANMPAVMGKAYLMGISLNGTPLAGSPFEIRVVPGPVYGPTCEVVRWHAAEEGLGDPIFVAGTRSQLVFQARDQYGNDQFTNNEPSNFLVEMSLRRRGSSGATQIIRGCTTNANSSTSCFGMLVGPYNADAAPPGQYAITFNSLVSSGINNADFSLTMRYCPDPSRCSSRQNFYNLNDPPGVTVYTAHTVKVNPAATFASECVAYGPDLTDGGVSGQQATFVIEARDRYSNRRLEGGDIFETIVYAPRNTIKISSGSAGANGERIVDNNDGTYVVYMLPEDPGRYTALIQLLRGPEDELTPATHFGFIRGSPFNPEYRLIDGNIAPAASRVVDELGLTLSALPSAPAGEDVRVLIQAYTVTTSNRMTPKKSGGDVVQAQLTIGIVGGGGRVIDLEVTDHQISPEPPNRTAGRYTALIPGDLIKTAQDYTLIVKACEAANPSSSITSRTCATGKQLQHIRGSPFIVLIDSGPMMAENSFVVELADPSRYINDGQGWEAGLVSTFTVQPRDVYNNNGSYDPLTSPEIAFELSATITGQSSGRVWERVSNTDPAGLQDGEYMVTTTFEGFYLFSFRADLAERVKVEVMQRDIVMRNSGAIVTVRPGALDVTNCIIDRTIGDFPVGETHIFILTTRDAYGNNLPEGGTDFEVELSLDNAFTEPGIGDNPLQAQSKSAADFIDVPDPDNPSNVIQVNQFNRNATYTYTGSGVNDPSVVVHMNLHIQDLLNGKYQVSYMSEAAGQATLSVRASTPAADGTLTTASVCTSESAFAWCSRLATIEGGSFRLAFEPLGPTADPDNMHSYIFSDLRHHEEIAAGSTATIVIRAFDMFKNPVTSDGFQFTSTLSLEGSEQRRLLGALDYVSCGAPEDGLCDGQVPNESYVIQYNPTKVGAYTLDVKRSGASLRSLGSDGTFRLLPFGPVAGETGFVVRPGPLDPDTTTITHRVNYVVNRRQDGAAHLALYAVAGVPETFYISGYDEFGNALTRGGEQPVVTIGLLYEGKVTDQQNGTYEVQYTVPAANVYQMEVKINQRRISLCERCRIVGFPTNIDGEAVTSRFFDSATSSFELHVNPATPVPSEFVALTSEVGAIAGVPTSIDVQVFDAFSNLISPSMGLWQCAERSQSDVCVESGAIVQPSVSVYAKILRRVVDEEDPTNTDGVNEPMPSNFPGVRNDDWSFRISYTLNTTGVYDIEFFGSVAGSAAVKFDSTEDGAVCPTDSDPDRVCASIDENPEVQPGLLDPATVAIEGNGLRPADDVFLDSGDGVDLAATITPTDELGNLLVAIDDGVFEADVRLDTARLPLEGHMTALASNAETSASFIQSVLLGKAVEGGTADSSGNGIGVSVFTPDDVLPGALDEVKHVNVTYTPTRAGKMSVAFRYLNLHVTGSPFVLFVSPGDIGGEIPAADDADARAGHALFCTDGNTCTEVMGFDQETCQQKGACSPGKLANHLEGQTARFEIIPRDIYGNSITAAGIRDGTVASKLAHCTGTHDIDCPIRARSSFATGDTPVTRSSYGDPGTWVEDSGAAPSERPTVTWDDERNIVIVRVPMFLPAGATGEVTVNITLHACRVDELSDSSCEDSKLTLDDIGLKLVSLTGGTAISLNVVQATPEQIQGIKLASDDGGHPLTLASGVGLAGSIAGTPGKFIVYAVAKVCTKDLSFGAPANPADVDYTPCSEDAWVSVPSPYEQTLTPSIVPAEGGDPLDATVTHNPDATYVVSYTGTATGDYVATLTVEGARLPIFLSSEIPTQGTITVFSGPASLAQSEVALASSTVAAGSQAFASVTLRDQHGNLAVPRDFVLLQDIIQASVEYTGPLELTLDQEALLSSSLVTTNNLDGTHSVLFNTRIAGNYSVSLFLLGESTVDSETGETAALEFQASPLSISVVPSSPSATTTTLEPGSSQSIPAMLANASARQTLQLRIVTRDQYDNAITSGGYAEDLFLTVDGLGGAFKEDLELADNQNGSYTATFVPPTIGVYTFSLFVDDVLVRTNQSLEYTDRGEVVNVPTDPAQSIATGQGIAGSRAGVPAEFAISVRDANGKDKDKAGHDDCPSDDACSISVLIEPVSPTNDYGVELETLEPPVQSDLAQPGRYTVTYTLANFGRYTMAVKIVDQHIQGSPFELTIDKEIAPAPSFASFSATATSLSVSFYDNDRTTLVSTNRGSLVGLDDCTKVFIPTTVAAFGASATCSFRTPFELVVYLGAGATVEPSTVLQLQSDFTPDRPGIINGRLTSGRVRGAIVVEYPDVAPRPTLVLRAPRVISTCDDLLIDATGSYGASGRTLRFAWGMLPNVPNEGTISDTLAAASATATQSSVLIPGSDLAPDIPYTFYVEVRNFLDTFSQQAFTVVRSSVPVPRLIVEGDTVLRVYRSQHVYIPVTVSIPDATGGSECRLDLAGAKMTYEWSFDQTQSVRVTFPLDEATRRSRVLYIPPGTLQAGQTYFLRVEGRVEGRPELSAEAVAIVQAKYEDLLVRLDMPSEITTEDDLTLSTALSVDPNDPTLPGEPPVAPFGPFLFSWQCNPVIDGIAQSTLACFDDVNGVLAPPPESFSITVPAGTLDVGEYEFTVTATKEPLVGPEGPLNRTRDIRKRIVVVPVPEAAEGEAAAVRKPIVNIDPLDRNVVNASDKLILSARLVVAYPDLTWSGEQKAVYFKQQMEAVDWEWVVAQGVLDVTDYPDTVSTSYLSPTLSISPNALAPGETYKFQLKATHRETGLVGQDEVEFQVNGAPTSGECGVNRNTGVAARDRFEFACNGWEDESLEALTYELLYEDPQSGDLIPLVPLSRSNVLADIYIPPVTRGMASDELVVHAVVSDFFGARTTVLLPISITMPSAQAAIADLVCSEAEDIMPGCPCGSAGCVQRYDGEPALVLDLMGDELALAEATNNVPSLITLAKSAAMLFNAWRTDLEATATAVISKASNEEPLNPEEQALYDKYSRGLLLSGIVASRLLASINRVGQTVQLSQKDLDLFGDALRELMRDEQVLDTGAASSAISVAVSRTSSVCVQPTGAQGILEAMSAVDGAVSSQSQGQIQAAATARRLAARRALLSGGLDAVEHSRRWLQQEIEASAEINKNLTNNYSNQAQLMNALACNLTPGEAGFGLSSKNIQVAVEVKQDPSGPIVPPAPGTTTSGTTARRSLMHARSLASTGTIPGFDVPEGTTRTGVPLNVVAKNNAVNPFQFVRTAGDTRVASSVASLEFSGTDGTPEQISLAAEQPSIRVTIPVSVSGSACRRTVGGCRYFNETTQTWETDGLFEVERTDTYIVCEAKHLTSFAISADDALPAFNVVDPIGDADLLTNITLENSLVFWVVGIILVSFGSLMILGARQDQRDRAKARLEGQLNRMERRILNPDKRLVDEVHDRKAGMLGRVVKLHRAKNGAAGPASQEDDGYLPKMGKALVDQHPVVSVLYTRPSDHFTRPQRLAVLLALILGQIAVVALFFGTDPSNLAAKAFIGIITAIALSPSKFAFRYLFEKASYVQRTARPPKKPRVGRRPRTRPVKWRIRVWTSNKRGAGTDATVSMHIYGLKGDYGPLVLPAGKEGFERGKMDEFEMIFPSPGDISKISIGHDGKGFGAGWHLDKVEIVNLETADAWLFRCGRWLDSNPRNDGGLLVRALDLPERYVDEEVRQMREAEARAIEEAARLRTQDDDRSTVGSRPATAESKKGGAQRHAGALAGAGAASGPGYLQAAGEGSFTGPDGRSVSQSQSQSAPAPPPPASGVPRPRRLNTNRTAVPVDMSNASSSVEQPPLPPQGSPMRPRRLKARAAALQALGILRAAVPRLNGPRPKGRGGEGEGARGVVPHQDASAVERHLRIRQLVGDQRDRDQGVDPELLAAVKRIQRGWRRRMAVIRRKQSLSAIRIQSAWRGYVARETVKEMLEDRATSQNIGHGVWFLDAHRGRRQGSAKESKRPASRAARMSRLSMMAGLGGDTQRRSSAAGRLTSSGGDALVSLPVRAWVKDAPEVARREGEEVQRRVMAMQAHKAKVREQRRAERRRQMRDRRLRRGLPRWFIWPTYILCGIFCAVAIWFIILYGLSFPPAIARAWLLSSLFAVFVELFVQDPLRVMFLAYLRARVDKARKRAEMGINDEEERDVEGEMLKQQLAKAKRGRARDKRVAPEEAASTAGSGPGGPPDKAPSNRVYPAP